MGRTKRKVNYAGYVGEGLCSSRLGRIQSSIRHGLHRATVPKGEGFCVSGRSRAPPLRKAESWNQSLRHGLRCATSLYTREAWECAKKGSLVQREISDMQKKREEQNPSPTTILSFIVYKPWGPGPQPRSFQGVRGFQRGEGDRRRARPVGEEASRSVGIAKEPTGDYCGSRMDRNPPRPFGLSGARHLCAKRRFVIYKKREEQSSSRAECWNQLFL